MSDGLLLGLDIGGTKCAALIGNGRGEVLEREQWASESERGPEAMLDDLLAASARLITKHRPARAGALRKGRE